MASRVAGLVGMAGMFMTSTAVAGRAGRWPRAPATRRPASSRSSRPAMTVAHGQHAVRAGGADRASGGVDAAGWRSRRSSTGSGTRRCWPGTSKAIGPWRLHAARHGQARSTRLSAGGTVDATAENWTKARRDAHDKGQRLEAAVDHLRQADKARRYFLASISHEVRTPLMLLMGGSSSRAGCWTKPPSEKEVVQGELTAEIRHRRQQRAPLLGFMNDEVIHDRRRQRRAGTGPQAGAHRADLLEVGRAVCGRHGCATSPCSTNRRGDSGWSYTVTWASSSWHALQPHPVQCVVVHNRDGRR